MMAEPFIFTQTDLYDLMTDQVVVAPTMIRMIVKRLRENQETRAKAAKA